MAINYEDLFTHEGFDYATDMSDLQGYIPEDFEDIASIGSMVKIGLAVLRIF